MTSLHLPYSVSLPGTTNMTLVCVQLVREIPGRREVYRGTLEGKSVYVKFFVDPRRGQRHYQREFDGERCLRDAGIVSPVLLYSGQVDGDYLVVYRAIEHGVDGEQLWRQADSKARHELLAKLTGTVAGLHNAGLVQRDLHFKNFVVSADVVYTLDAGDIHKDPALSQGRARDNLLLLFAQCAPGHDRQSLELLPAYCQRRGWTEDAIDAEQALQRIRHLRAARWHAYAKKIYRQCTDFEFSKTWRLRMLVDRNELSEDLRRVLDNPDAVIKASAHSLKQGNTSTVAVVTIDGKPRVIKRYNIKGFWHGLNRLFRRSRASISWCNAHRLRFHGIATPKPIALLEHRFGPLRWRAYFICEYITGPTALDYFSSKDNNADAKKQVADSIVTILNALAALRIGHGDMKATNFIIHDHQAYLIDLDAMRSYDGGYRYRRAYEKDIKRFLRNWDEQPETGALFAGLELL